MNVATYAGKPRAETRCSVGTLLLYALVATSVAGMPRVYAQTAEDDTSSAASEWLQITPQLIGPTKSFNPGIRTAIQLDRTVIRVSTTHPRRFQFSFGADLPFAWDPERNPESLEVEARFGLLVALMETPEPGPGGLPPLTAPRRWGFFELLLEGGLEASQEIENADFELGATAAYDHDQRRLWFVPGVEASFLLVDCLGCDVPEETGTWFRRLDLRAGWSIPLDPVLPDPLDPFRIRPQGRYFHTWGLDDDLAGLRNEDGTWWSVELAYAFDAPYWLHEVHAGWRGGEVPTRLADERAWTVGVTLIL